MNIKHMRKGQGSLEYLIIIAAVLAIAAVVIMYLTGILGGVPASFAECQQAAASCASMQATSPAYNCQSMCEPSCIGPDGTDIISGEAAVDACDVAPVTPSACGYCMVGDKNSIVPP